MGTTVRQQLEKREGETLRRGAALSTDDRLACREHAVEPCPFRTQFQRDYTRIIHSRAFRRLRHKTQVFISPKNDHLCTRLEHSLHVASVATTVARALDLNEDLVQAIAVGHDLGHAPFGHKGETSLNRLAEKHRLTFAHELHSLRVVDVLESPYLSEFGYPGLNLTFAVRDGIVCHYGEGFEPSLSPDREKQPGDLKNTARGEARPATLEGCVVRWADKVAYLGRDLEDAYTLDLVKSADLPESVRRRLGTTNREIISALISELVSNSPTDSDSICVGADVHEALNDLYTFNLDRIYKTDEAMRHYGQIDRAMVFLFDFLRTRLDEADGDIKRIARGDEKTKTLVVFADFLTSDIQEWRGVQHERLVLDFIAGMTDSFFADSFIELFLPRGTA